MEDIEWTERVVKHELIMYLNLFLLYRDFGKSLTASRTVLWDGEIDGLPCAKQSCRTLFDSLVCYDDQLTQTYGFQRERGSKSRKTADKH
jgi:hypothetical protein